MIRTAILGASGFVGGEVLRLLAGHPQLRVARLVGDSKAGQSLAQVHPHLAAAYPEMKVEAWDPVVLDAVDLVLAALPHGQSQLIAPAIVERSIPFVDLGADFRLGDAATYEHWYGHAHSAPDLLDQFVYGIPEFHRAEIMAATAVAAAGCYATAAILALRPLVDAGVIQAGSVIVDAASGVSGAGRGATEATGFSAVDGNFTAYGLLNHRHTAEMEMELGGPILFTPHVVPMTRGILATCYGTAAGSCDPLDILARAYADEPFVHVTTQPLATKWVSGSNGAQLTARYDARSGRIIALAAIDNLGKGAAGQMIQCANLMLGLDESVGLTTTGVYP